MFSTTGSDWRANPRPVDDDNVSQEVVEAIKDAVKAGFRSFDTAEVSTHLLFSQHLQNRVIDGPT